MSHNPPTHTTLQPSLLAGPEDFARLRSIPSGSLPGELLAFLHHAGEAMLPLPLLEEKLTGIRLLHVARQALKRISTWGLLYQLDSDRRWLDRAAAELENISAFTSWNPRHFLDAAEMTLVCAIGLDWLGQSLQPDLRERIRRAILEKGLQPSLDERAVHNWWLGTHNNWNPVCHASLIAGALALGRETPIAGQIMARALALIPKAMDETLPDGIYPEGATYWEFGTHYTVLAIELLRRGGGSPSPLEAHPSFFPSVHFFAASIAPGGDHYNFFDCGLASRFSPVLCWFASRGDAIAQSEMHRSLRHFLKTPDWQPDDDGQRLLALAALWFPTEADRSEEIPAASPRCWHGRGVNPVAIVRDGPPGPGQFYFACKGGSGTVSHAHLDAGSFILEDRGVRWALDLGTQEYHSLESKGIALWDQHQLGDRWRVFRCGPYSHNLLLIDEQLPDATAKVDITECVETEDQVRITLDLTPAYHRQVSRYTRSFTIHSGGVLRITDQVEGGRLPNQRFNNGGATLHWRMVTAAAIHIDGQRATLQQDGQTLYVHVLSPDKFNLRNQSLEQPPYWWDAPNPGISALDLWTHVDASGKQEITFLLSGNPDAI